MTEYASARDMVNNIVQSKETSGTSGAVGPDEVLRTISIA